MRDGVVAIVATWNRGTELARCLRAIGAQIGGAPGLVVVVDNASENGGPEQLLEDLPGAREVANQSPSGERPSFKVRREASPGQAGERVVLVRNRRNLGGTGAFNTGMSYVRSMSGERVEAVWLVDDDAVVQPDALGALLSTMRQDPRVGLVGSRTVRIDDPNTTLESTIFFDPATGYMRDRPPTGHRMADACARMDWTDVPSGVVEVDVVSACSMLARWSSVERVGPWDESFFLYCDDADWCLRFARAGLRVVNCLGARVGHTPWHEKLSPAREYYATRNAMWMHRRAVGSRGERRRLALRWSARLLRESARRWKRGDRAGAWMQARAVLDAMMNRGGPLPGLETRGEPSRAAFWSLWAAGVLVAGLSGLVARGRPAPTWGKASGLGAGGDRA